MDQWKILAKERVLKEAISFHLSSGIDLFFLARALFLGLSFPLDAKLKTVLTLSISCLCSFASRESVRSPRAVSRTTTTRLSVASWRR
jgi:hypothetical protein